MNNLITQYHQGIPTTADVAALASSDPVDGATSTDATHIPLSAESLLYYCSSRLDSIDQQIDRYFKEQMSKNKASKELSDVQGLLGRASFQKDGKDFTADDANIHANEANELLDMYRKAESPEGRQAAAEAFKLRSGRDIGEYADGRSVTPDDIMGSKAEIKGQDATQWASRIDNIKSKSSEVSKSAELNMIQLQSLVSQRQLAVQLTTQLMQSVNESMKGIAANCRG